ncbi:MarR family winged helix-turn-helix transcriptional regulator [Pectinatus frisingensis]|uniref:MarR family winged helix-turn-helix transcriptional regulator n=1 Tax=Pectinatus frisingensis TaxID=865 RepID=UPI0018C55C5B|nr:MarR family transcriptional regulator [Pectinatus frisingensis]
MREKEISELHNLFHKMGNLRERFFHQFSEGSVMPLGQCRVVHCLIQSGEIAQNELIKKMTIRPGSLSELLGKLKKNGYVERIKDDKDRRRMLIRLTEKGRTAAVMHHQIHVRIFDKMFSALSDEELTDLHRILEKLVHSWDDINK